MACPLRFKERVIVVKPLPVCARRLPRTSPHNGLSPNFTTNSLFSVAWAGEDPESDSEEERKAVKASAENICQSAKLGPSEGKNGRSLALHGRQLGLQAKSVSGLFPNRKYLTESKYLNYIW